MWIYYDDEMRVYICRLIYHNVILYLATIVGEQKSQVHIILMHQATIILTLKIHGPQVIVTMSHV